MIRKQVDVKSEKKIVGQATYPVFDNVQEAVAELGESAVVKLINSQIRTNEMNTVRAAMTGRPSEKVLRDEAFLRLAGRPADLAACNSDKARLSELIETIVAEIKAERGIKDDDDENEENGN